MHGYDVALLQHCTSNMAAVTIVDRMTPLSPHVAEGALPSTNGRGRNIYASAVQMNEQASSVHDTDTKKQLTDAGES